MNRAAILLLAVLPLHGQEWPVYGGDAAGTKHSPLKQINRSNVKNLKPAWIFDTGDFSDGTTMPNASSFEATPLMVDGILYVSTPFHRLFALNPETGRMLWSWDSHFDTRNRVVVYLSRGVTYWSDGTRKRIFLADQQGRLFAIDAKTGKTDTQFGEAGMVNLQRGFVEDFPRGQYGITSPPSVCGTTLVTGSWVSDSEPHGPSGDVRGFDPRTGKERWRFHTVPRPGEFGHDTWGKDSWRDRGGLNAWSIMTVDQKRGMVFLPLTSPSYDYYGGDRPGQNLFGDSVVSLDCETGKRIWHYQTVHHNTWDYDLPSQPMLVTVQNSGKAVDAVAQSTKTGFVFLLDRLTGKPLFEVQERPVPPSKVPGEESWPTQPFPVKPPPFARQSMTLKELTTVTPESRKECLAMIEGAEVEGGLFRPLTEKPTVYFPGTNGGSNWGGGSFDPATGTLYVNSMDVGAFTQIEKRPEQSSLPYRAKGLGRFWDSNHYPCQQPPWGSLTAIDLNRGEIRWRAVLGEFDELTARGIPKTGAPNLGGSIVTDGGLVFIAATNDSRFRAFDKDTGEEIWTARLPASGHATPMTYQGRTTGRQFVVIAAGGGNKYNKTFASKLVAFALPRSGDPVEVTTVTAPRRVTIARAQPGYAGKEENLPVAVKAQPVPFSHRVHAGAAALKCQDCHTGALNAEKAGIPATAKCMACHNTIAASSSAIANLRNLSVSGQPIPWVKVYDLPDFVVFDHKTHAAAKVACIQCHGDVAKRDVLAKEVSTSMTACMNCHVQHRARVDCSACHALGQ
jgi:glucose dehydrogenase